MLKGRYEETLSVKRGKIFHYGGKAKSTAGHGKVDRRTWTNRPQDLGKSAAGHGEVDRRTWTNRPQDLGKSAAGPHLPAW